MATFSDYVAITNSGTANAESAQSTMQVTANCTIYEMVLTSLTVGTTYAVRVDAPGIEGPQKYVMPCNGAAANTNGGKLCPASATIKCNVHVPGSEIKVSTFAGVASATCRVCIKWKEGKSGTMTFGDFATATPGTAGTEAAAATSIAVHPGKSIKLISVANPDFLGSIYGVRLEAAGLRTPQRFSLPAIYEATGTEIEYSNAWTQLPIEVDIPIPATVNAITSYATADVNSTKCVIGLTWQ